VLAKDASDWPGLDAARVRRDYVDPVAFIVKHMGEGAAVMPPVSTYPIITVKVMAVKGLNIRRDPVASSPSIGTVAQWDVFDIVDDAPNATYNKLAGRDGYVATQYLRLVSRATMYCSARNGLNIRRQPNILAFVLGTISYNVGVEVWIGSEQGVWLKLAVGSGWASRGYLRAEPA
jgi:hypothetical protein